jgi:hypothetical protein
MKKRARIGASLLLVVAAWAGSARAADPRAEQLFREGRAAMDAQQWDAACAKFEESLSLETSIGPLLNLAECREKQGKLARAFELWTRGLSAMPSDDGRRALAERKIADLERRVPKLIVNAPEGAKVFVDGVEVTPGQPVRVDPGARSIVVNVGEKSRTITTQAEEGRVVPVDGRPSESRIIGPVAAPEPESEPDDAPAIVAFAVGGAGLVGFGVTGVLYLGESSTVDEQCSDGVCRSQEGVDAGDARTTLGVVNAISLGVGVVGVGLGAFFLVTASSDQDGAAARTETDAHVRFTPGLGGGALSGRF